MACEIWILGVGEMGVETRISGIMVEFIVKTDEISYEASHESIK